MHDLLGAHKRLEQLYRFYIRSAFPLRSVELARERDAVLERPGVLCQSPLVETVPRYPSSQKTIIEAAQALPSHYRDLHALAKGLIANSEKTLLYSHQWSALRAVIEGKSDLVVTTGTGSGKTECFLLPLLAHLARESQTWSSPYIEPEGRYWW